MYKIMIGMDCKISADSFQFHPYPALTIPLPLGPSMYFYPDFISIFSNYYEIYPDFFSNLLKFFYRIYPNFIWIWFRKSHDKIWKKVHGRQFCLVQKVALPAKWRPISLLYHNSFGTILKLCQQILNFIPPTLPLTQRMPKN